MSPIGSPALLSGVHDFFLADDLSGALDAAAAFYHAGQSVRIALGIDDWAQARPDEVVGVTTETRNAKPADAAVVVRQTLRHAAHHGRTLRYKKIDSTLRGPVAAELRALLETMPPRTRALFAPANPRVGRTVRDGVLLVHGVPVAETDFGRDPACPLRDSAIRRILGDAATKDVVIPDTATAADLAQAVREMDAAGGDWVAIGSGALAVPVTGRLAKPPQKIASPPTVADSPILMIGGSAHPLNRTQAGALLQERQLHAHEVAVASPTAAGQAAAITLRKSGGAILQLPATRIAPVVALQAIVDAAVTAIEAAGVTRVFATGGETAFALCQRLGIRTLLFLEEIEPGLSLSYGEGPNGPLLLAVKPGGFGDQETWVRAWNALRAQRPITG